MKLRCTCCQISVEAIPGGVKPNSKCKTCKRGKMKPVTGVKR